MGATLDGTLQVGLIQPMLKSDLRLSLRESVGGMRVFALNSQLLSGWGREQLAGSVTVAGGTDRAERFRMNSEVALLRNSLRLNSIEIKEAGRSGSLTGEGEVGLLERKPQVSLYLVARKLDLSKETGFKTVLDSQVTLSGPLEDYRGTFNLTLEGANLATQLEGAIGGSMEGITLRIGAGKLLNGAVGGTLAASWAKGLSVEWALDAKRLDPGVLAKEWRGEVNLQTRGELSLTDGSGLSATIDARLLESHLMGRSLNGRLEARWRRDDLYLDRFDLRGPGFDLAAHGASHERIVYDARVTDLSGLVPGSGGQLSAAGWVSWPGGGLSGTLRGEAKNLHMAGMRADGAKIEAQLSSGKEGRVDGSLRVQRIEYGGLRLASAALDAHGRLGDHVLRLHMAWPGNQVEADARGGYTEGGWTGSITRISGQDSIAAWRLIEPAALRLGPGRVRLGASRLESVKGEKLEAAADIDPGTWRGSVMTAWHDVNLSRLNTLATGAPSLSGRTTGSFAMEPADRDHVRLSGALAVDGAMAHRGVRLAIGGSGARLNWDEHGLAASWEFKFGEAGSWTGRAASAERAALSLPRTASLEAAWNGLDLTIVRSFLPSSVALQGLVSGRAKGNLLPEGRIDAKGEAAVTGGSVDWHSAEGRITALLEKAEADWTWREGSLGGNVAIVLANRGRVSARFGLPLEARIPSAIKPDGPLEVTLKGDFREKGLLSAVFPGVVAESHGSLHVDTWARGTWANPVLGGRADLADAGATLPSAGIRLQDVAASAELSPDAIRVTRLFVRSGPGSVKGSGLIRLKEGRPAVYEGSLSGERFQIVNLPELRALVSPNLEFRGEGSAMSVKGSVLVPEANIEQKANEKALGRSADVVVVDGKTKDERRPVRLPLDAEVTVELGNKVFAKAEGLDARLEGKVLVSVKAPDRITTRGEIRVVQGQYTTYGVKLDITRGRIVFSGAPDRATLDVLALRKIDARTVRAEDVKAGVLVTGTVLSPAVRLYSEPAMADADVLSYIVLGRPPDKTAADVSVLSRASSALLGVGPSASVQAELKKRFGIDVVDVQSQQGDVKRSMVTLGKYLTPELYVGFGRSLFSDEYLLTMRYSLSKHWEVESQTGQATGADVYFKIEFD
jgi:translocation and assembly module TamB